MDGMTQQNPEPPEPFSDLTDGATESFTLTKPLLFWQLQTDIEEALGRDVLLDGVLPDPSAPASVDNPMELFVHVADEFTEAEVEAIQAIVDDTEPRDPSMPATTPPTEVVVTPPTDDSALQDALDSLAAGDTLTTKDLSMVLRSFVSKGVTPDP
jgi:hypothetical protein